MNLLKDLIVKIKPLSKKLDRRTRLLSLFTIIIFFLVLYSIIHASIRTSVVNKKNSVISPTPINKSVSQNSNSNVLQTNSTTGDSSSNSNDTSSTPSPTLSPQPGDSATPSPVPPTVTPTVTAPIPTLTLTPTPTIDSTQTLDFSMNLDPQGSYTPNGDGSVNCHVVKNPNGYWDFVNNGNFSGLLPGRNYQFWFCGSNCSSAGSAKFTTDGNGQGSISNVTINHNQNGDALNRAVVWEVPPDGELPNDPTACFMISNNSTPCLKTNLSL